MASLHFCSECNNLLYPKADPERRAMVYACRICPFDDVGENQCVYRNDLLTVTRCVMARFLPKCDAAWTVALIRVQGADGSYGRPCR